MINTENQGEKAPALATGEDTGSKASSSSDLENTSRNRLFTRYTHNPYGRGTIYHKKSDNSGNQPSLGLPK